MVLWGGKGDFDFTSQSVTISPVVIFSCLRSVLTVVRTRRTESCSLRRTRSPTSVELARSLPCCLTSQCPCRRTTGTCRGHASRDPAVTVAPAVKPPSPQRTSKYTPLCHTLTVEISIFVTFSAISRLSHD